jgi:hypothetical protein
MAISDNVQKPKNILYDNRIFTPRSLHPVFEQYGNLPAGMEHHNSLIQDPIVTAPFTPADEDKNPGSCLMLLDSSNSVSKPLQRERKRKTR